VARAERCEIKVQGAAAESEKQMCDICIEVDGGDGDKILSAAQVDAAAVRGGFMIRELMHEAGATFLQLRSDSARRFST
jgi:hypothetical protein